MWRFGLIVTAAVLLVPAVMTSTAQAHAEAATVPRPDHVVILVEENHSATGIIGNPDAPYITDLADQNANFVHSYAVTHPSEPNYLALYSGSTQGLTDDSCPHTYNTPNLGQRLRDAGLGFTGYSEGLPSAGYAGCYSGNYARKHNPWSNFPAVPASASQPFSAFPTDYSKLPAVSIVVPNLQNDMHDGTVAQGDAWVRNNLGGYIAWAKTHNSLFVLTFDEDDLHSGNRIATILAGERVVPGTYTETINHYNVLRTVTDAFGLAPIGNAANAAPITDVWSTGGAAAGVRFVGAANAGGGNTRMKQVVVPAAAQAGDTAVLMLAATSSATWTGPSGVSGWTPLGGFVGGRLATTVWVKRLVAGDAGRSVRFDSAGYSHASANVLVYRGVDAAAPVAGFAHTADSGGVSHTTPSLPALAGSFVVSLWADRAATVRTWSAPTGLVVRDASPDSGSSLTVQALLADSGASSAGGSAGGLSATTDAATSGTAMWTLVLHAA